MVHVYTICFPVLPHPHTPLALTDPKFGRERIKHFLVNVLLNFDLIKLRFLLYFVFATYGHSIIFIVNK
jgi:hypothetical protein